MWITKLCGVFFMRSSYTRTVPPLEGTMQTQDFESRAHFCRRFLHPCMEKPDFPRQILFTDEAKFTREVVLNSRNSHMWAEENPHVARSHGFQERYSLNIWAGSLDGCVTGPYLLPPNLTGAAYLRFLEGVLHGLLEDVPLDVRQNMRIQHDVAPPRFTRVVRGHLVQRFRQTWIGCGNPIGWPARSPHLNPLDYFLRGHMKSLVFDTSVDSEEDFCAGYGCGGYRTTRYWRSCVREHGT